MKILILEAVLANLLMCGGTWKHANLWLLPSPKMLGTRIGIHAETQDDAWWWWFYTERCKSVDLVKQVGSISRMRRGDLGSMLLERVAQPRELGPAASGPAVWVFSQPRIETISGRTFRAGYSDQPHVIERDRLALASARKESESVGEPSEERALPV